MYWQILGPFNVLWVSPNIEVMNFVRGRHVFPAEAVLNRSRIRYSALTAMVTSIVTASPTWTRCIDSNSPNGFVTAVVPPLKTILYQEKRALWRVFIRVTQLCRTPNQLNAQGIMLDHILSYHYRQREYDLVNGILTT